MRTIYNKYLAYGGTHDPEFAKIEEGLYEFIRAKLLLARDLGINPREISHHIIGLTLSAESEVVMMWAAKQSKNDGAKTYLDRRTEEILEREANLLKMMDDKLDADQELGDG